MGAIPVVFEAAEDDPNLLSKNKKKSLIAAGEQRPVADLWTSAQCAVRSRKENIKMKTPTVLLSLMVASLAQEESALTRANNEFSFRLLRYLPSSRDQNVFFSPYSVHTALGMVYAGARGRSQRELSRILGYSNSQFPYVEVIDAYRTRQSKTTDYNSTLNVANGAAIQETLPLSKSYESILENSFGAQLHKVDFIKEQQAAVDRINSWVRNKTHDKIDGILETPISRDTELVFLNAMYFKGDWNTKFDKNLTEKRPFFSGGRIPIKVETMSRKIRVGYGSSRWLRADFAELPFHGGDLSMVVLLPTWKTQIQRLKRRLTWTAFRSVLSMLRNREVNIFIPKFKLKTQYPLKRHLRSLGIRRIFSRGADFSGITAEKTLRVSEIVHKAVLEVDENGADAAAAAGGIGFQSLSYRSKPEPIEFKVDHPFLFFIRNARTNDILFAGQVNTL